MFINVVEPLPGAVSLVGNYPNPFLETTQILHDLPAANNVSMDVMDMLGRLVVLLPEQNIAGGSNRRTVFNSGLLASGLYVNRVTVTTSKGSEVHTGSFVHAI